MMRRWTAACVLVLVCMLFGCSRYEPSAEIERSIAGTEADVSARAEDGTREEAAGEEGSTAAGAASGGSQENGSSQNSEGQETEEGEPITISTYPPRNPVKVKGIYVSAYVAGTETGWIRLLSRWTPRS